MKIIVTHEGKQYVNRLLIAIDQKKWLVCFFTGFSGNAYVNRLAWFPMLKRQLKKRTFYGINNSEIVPYYLSFLVEKLSFREYDKYRFGARLFDWWASRKLEASTFDVVISYENSNLITFQQAKKLGKTTVLDLAQVHHSTIDMIRKSLKIDTFTTDQVHYLNTRKQAALDLSDYIFTLSSFATKSLTDNGFYRSRIYELNLGIDVNQFTALSRVKDSQFRILFVGTVTYRKGIDLLLSVFRELDLLNAELTLIGPVSDGGDLLSNCTANIRHLPFLHHDELVKYYQQADVFIFPSYLDSWGQVVLEAMACGTPVIISDNTGAKDAVAKGGGFIVPTGDAAALREKIRYMYDHRDEAEQMGYEARRVAEGYTWENYYQQVTDALTDIAQRKGIPV